MNIIIAGAGKVGFNLAKTLCIGHNVSIIDQNSQALQRIQETLDILPIKGDVEDSKTYQSFLNQHIDLFIAVTNIDNVNLMAIMIADSVLTIDRRFVRLQKYFFDKKIIKQKLSVDKVIFPIILASKAIASLLSYPKANNIKIFKYTKHKLISIMSTREYNVNDINSQSVQVIAIERRKEFIILKEDDFIIEKDDLLYMFGLEEDIRDVCSRLDTQDNSKIQKCVVFGGEELGIGISKELLAINRNVKLVEKDLELCEIADEALEGKASVINSKYGTSNIFEEEGLCEADIFIAATQNDEYNIIKCLEAKEHGINKVVAINNELQYYNLMHSLGIVVVRGPKISAYNTIMEEISSTGVVIQKSFCGAKGVVFMRRIFHKSILINKKIKPLSLLNTLVFYMRKGILYKFDEKIILQEDDLIVAFCTEKQSAKVKQWIYGL